MLSLMAGLEDASATSILLVLVPLCWAIVKVMMFMLTKFQLHSPVGMHVDGSQRVQVGRQVGLDQGGRILAVLAEPCGPVGSVGFNNDPSPLLFESDVAHGSVLFLHRPTGDTSSCVSGNYPYGDHMHGRKRLWEFRWQLSFKKEVDGQIFLGLEQDKYVPVTWAQRFVAGNVLRALRSASGGAMYQSYGDNPGETKGERERPVIVFPLSLVDQLIVTPAGETPPSLSDPSFSTFGITKANDRTAFRKAINKVELGLGPTYTFAFWGVSQFCDAIGWRAPARALLPEVSFLDVGILPPCFFVMYSLKPQGTNEKRDSRHLDSRKAYSVRMAYWSTLVPPDPARADELMKPGRQAQVTQVTSKVRTNRGEGFWGCC